MKIILTLQCTNGDSIYLPINLSEEAPTWERGRPRSQRRRRRRYSWGWHYSQGRRIPTPTLPSFACCKNLSANADVLGLSDTHSKRGIWSSKRGIWRRITNNFKRKRPAERSDQCDNPLKINNGRSSELRFRIEIMRKRSGFFMFPNSVNNRGRKKTPKRFFIGNGCDFFYKGTRNMGQLSIGNEKQCFHIGSQTAIGHHHG